MSVSLRRMRYEDLESMQDCNVNCLPENYQLKVRGGVRRAELASASLGPPGAAPAPLRLSARFFAHPRQLSATTPPPPPCARSTGCTTR